MRDFPPIGRVPPVTAFTSPGPRGSLATLRAHSWSAVGIELVIVVLGVFIGIQVSNWNQDRLAKRQASEFAIRLKADLREEDWRYQYLLAYSQEVLANANLAANALEGTHPLEDEALLIAAYRATQYKGGLRRRATYDELIATGTIGLIRDQTLRDTAMRVYSMTTFDSLIQEGVGSRYRELFRMSLPNEVQRALARSCGDKVIRPGDVSAIHGTLDYPCSSGLPASVIAESAATLRSDPDFLRFLRLRIADVETRIVDLRGNNRSTMENLRTLSTTP
jgi:hypothetical protein